MTKKESIGLARTKHCYDYDTVLRTCSIQDYIQSDCFSHAVDFFKKRNECIKYSRNINGLWTQYFDCIEGLERYPQNPALRFAEFYDSYGTKTPMYFDVAKIQELCDSGNFEDTDETAMKINIVRSYAIRSIAHLLDIAIYSKLEIGINIPEQAIIDMILSINKYYYNSYHRNLPPVKRDIERRFMLLQLVNKVVYKSLFKGVVGI